MCHPRPSYLNSRPSSRPVTLPAARRPMRRPTRPFLTAFTSPIRRAMKYSQPRVDRPIPLNSHTRHRRHRCPSRRDPNQRLGLALAHIPVRRPFHLHSHSPMPVPDRASTRQCSYWARLPRPPRPRVGPLAVLDGAADALRAPRGVLHVWLLSVAVAPPWPRASPASRHGLSQTPVEFCAAR